MANDEATIRAMAQNQRLRQLGLDFLVQTAPYKYSYGFSWLGRPIIQFPQDLVAIQEIIWSVKPDLIVETGVAHGGSLVLSASILELLGRGEVVGIDIEIRPHNRDAIERHPLAHRIKLLEGSSTASEVIDRVRRLAEDKQSVLVFLDSNHTHEHVLQELRMYSPLVSMGSYIVAFDTVIEDMPDDSFPNRPWGKGNNPKTAVWEFMRENDEFEIDKDLENKLLISVAPSGYLKRVRP